MRSAVCRPIASRTSITARAMVPNSSRRLTPSTGASMSPPAMRCSELVRRLSGLTIERVTRIAATEQQYADDAEADQEP